MEYPEYIVDKLANTLNERVDIEKRKLFVRSSSPNEVFDWLCDWEGLVHYGSIIRRWIKDIYGIDLDDVK